MIAALLYGYPARNHPSAEASGRLWTLESSVKIPTQYRAHLCAPGTTDLYKHVSDNGVSRHKGGIKKSEVRGETTRSSDISPGLN